MSSPLSQLPAETWQQKKRCLDSIPPSTPNTAESQRKNPSTVKLLNVCFGQRASRVHRFAGLRDVEVGSLAQTTRGETRQKCDDLDCTDRERPVKSFSCHFRQNVDLELTKAYDGQRREPHSDGLSDRNSAVSRAITAKA
jgi:hypothetical protein